MIVSALVLTSRGSVENLAKELSADERLTVGNPEKGFLPVVVTTESLGASRKFYEELRQRSGVDDVQLVSWADEEALVPGETGDDARASKEMS